MTRFKFWMSYLAVVIVAGLIGGIIGYNSSDVEVAATQAQALGSIMGLVVMLPVMWFRLGDAGKSRHWMWLMIVPIASLVPFLMAGLSPTAEKKLPNEVLGNAELA